METQDDTKRNRAEVILNSARSRRYVFTINNYTEVEYDTIIFTLKSENCKWIIGKEVGENETPHLQGYVSYTSARTFASMKKFLPRAHIEKAKGDDKQNYMYCSKEGKFEGNIDIELMRAKLARLVLAEYKEVKWLPWQEDILRIIKEKPDNRIIHWYWDDVGNVGKSFISTFICLTFNAVLCQGKANDIKNQVNDMIENNKMPEVIILDIPRSNLAKINYGLIESLKNGMIYSGKYEGGLCIFPKPHVIIFANEEPELTSLSADRWRIQPVHGIFTSATP